MLGNTPEFAAHLQDMGIQDVAVIEAAFMIEDEPAANLRQFGWRKVIQHSLGNQLDKKDTGGVEDTAQQAPFQRQSIALIDIVKCAQGEDRAFEFGCASAAEWNHAATRSIAGTSSVRARRHRSLQPRTCRST